MPSFAFSGPLLASSTKFSILHLTLRRLPSKVIPMILVRPLSTLTPRNAIFRKLLELGLQGGLRQLQIVHLANSHDRHAREPGGD